MRWKFFAWALCVAVPAGCASVDPIETSGNPAALPPFSTFRVYQEQFTFAVDLEPAKREHIAGQLREAAVAALKERGYREATDADVLVMLGAISRPTLPDENESRGGGLTPVDTSVLDPSRPNMPVPEMPPSGAGREGDLILELLDAKTRKSIWHASSTGSATTPGEALRKARATYAAMVARLPKAAQTP
jgi:hypothetical protein